MEAKELYEALDTVWAALPNDAAQQEFVEVVRVLLRVARYSPSLTQAGDRWLLETAAIQAYVD